MHKDDTNTRIRLNALRLLEEKGLKQAEVARNAQSKGHTLDAPYLNNILQGRVAGLGKIDAIAAGLKVDVSLLTQPVIEGST